MIICHSWFQRSSVSPPFPGPGLAQTQLAGPRPTRQGLSNIYHCSGSSLPTTGQVLATDKRFSTLLLALEIAFGNETGLEPPFTVFAPTAQAFNKLDNSTLSSLLQSPADLAQGGNILSLSWQQ